MYASPRRASLPAAASSTILNCGCFNPLISFDGRFCIPAALPSPPLPLFPIPPFPPSVVYLFSFNPATPFSEPCRACRLEFPPAG
eukprot:3826804-Rhodomonas_salina.1